MKRIAALRDLSDDHHTGLVLAQRCRRAAHTGAGPDCAGFWDRVRAVFAAQLEPHFQIEEAHLLPALEVLGEAALARRIATDHRRLRERAARAPDAVDPEHLVVFGDGLRAHIRFEEREVFEAVQHRLPAVSLEALARASRRLRRTNPDWGQI